MRTVFSLLCVTALSVPLIGCQQAPTDGVPADPSALNASDADTSNEESGEPTETPPMEATTAEKATPEPAAQPETVQSWDEKGVTLQVASWEQAQQVLAKHKGKIVVLDIWSVWCLPCVRELPHLVELQQKYPEQVVCISYNINYDGRESSPPESHAPDVLEVLVEKDAKIINLLSSTADEELYEQIDLASIPVAYVYGTDGKLLKRFDNETQAYGEDGFTYNDHIIPYVDMQLNKDAKP